MAKLYNLARMTTATTGTGTITLGSAASGYLTFALAGVADGETVTYAIADGANREIGRGVYTASGTTLTRSVLKSTNADAAINLSGSAEVFITAAAEDIAPVGSVVQVVNTTFTTKGTTAVAIPADDTIPQQGTPGEGLEIFTASITPTSASNILKIDVIVHGSNSNAGGTFTVALFKDSAADAIAAVFFSVPTGSYMVEAPLQHWRSAGSTSAQTFKVRVGGNIGTITYNGANNTRYYGGTVESSITITEIKA